MPVCKSLTLKIPARDGQLEFWLTNFAEVIASDPIRFGFTPNVAARLTDLAKAYADALHETWFPDRKTTLAIAAKNQAKAAALDVFRACARQIKADPTLSGADLVTLGFRVARRR